MEDLVVGDGRFAARWIDDRHFLAIHRMPTDVGENAVLGGLWDTLGDREINFFHRSSRELAHERLMGDIRLGDHDASGCVLVQSMDDSGALDSTDSGKFSNKKRNF